MRILAVRGANLASLGEPFALDLEQEPLRSAGLFAITGETGAGKSTILDALCLALYDKFPRVVGPGASEEVPDPSGKALDASDPRTILRRGAANGFAEADFIARDGRRYRARCKLMRARGKANGRLQSRMRSLYHIDENGVEIAAVDSGVEAVNKRIVDLTDLTFEQFRRTALLAQGDFDAFLRAEEKERAELLEKITGAEIYGLLSKRAHETAADARRNVAALERRQAEIGLMSNEERRAADAEWGTVDARRAEIATERAKTQAQLRRHDAFIQTQAKLAHAVAAHDAARDTFDALTPQRETLANAARAEPLRAPRVELRRVGASLDDVKAEAIRALSQSQEARASLDAAEENERAASEQLLIRDGEIARFAPIWAQAAELDARVAAMAQEEAAASGLAAEAARRANEKREALAAALSNRTEVSHSVEEARDELLRLSPARALSERWGEIDEWLEKRAELSKKKRDAEVALGAAGADLARLSHLRAALDADDEKDRAARDSLFAQISERDCAYASIDEAATLRRLEEISHQSECLQALTRLAHEYGEATAQAARGEEEAGRCEKERAVLARRLEALGIERQRQAALSADASRLGELAEAAADPDALRLRAALEADEPCPVCGGRDHPFARNENAAHALVEALRARRDDARSALVETDNAIVAARSAQAQASAIFDAAARRLSESKEAMARAARDFKTWREKISTFGGLVPTEIETATPLLETINGRVAREREDIKRKLDAARLLRSEIDRLRKERDDKSAAIDARRGDCERARALAEDARATIAWVEAEIANGKERVESLDRSLAEFLPPCDLSTADLERDTASARRRLKDFGARFEAAQQRASRLNDEVAQLDVNVATLEADVRNESANECAASVALLERQHEAEALRHERAQLLDGEATAAHRARVDDAQRAAAHAREIARDALGAAKAAEAAATAQKARCDESLVKAGSAVSAARDSFCHLLAQTGFDERAATALLDIPAEHTKKMRSDIEAAQGELAGAAAAVAAREADLEEAQATGALDEQPEALAAHDAALSQEHDALAGRLGELRAMIAQDDRGRLQAQALASEIDEARASSRIWDEVDAAIGSASGDKFRRFAQSVTLEQLVALANQRLALLTPRYRLERAGDMGSLGLQIIDRDLGDERRSTRSLSGGERFLASLALALALAGLEGRDSFVDTLFIDEGFGALDSGTLDIAIDALENLQGQGRKVGVISHVESLQTRIATKVCVERRGGGASVVRIIAPGFGGQ